jgi:hypothetical protein
MTNSEQETQKAVDECTMTKIHRQSTNQDIDCLDNELIAIAFSFPSELGEGLHGHEGLIKSIANYEIFALGTPFIVPAIMGIYLQGNIPVPQCGQQEAEHKALVAQFQTYIGASRGLKDLIL